MAKVFQLTDIIYTVDEKRKKLGADIKYYFDESQCHICISHALDKDGYPRITRFGHGIRLSHYIIYLETGELVPKGKVVMHSCDNPNCINPAHLKVGTHKENMADCVAKGRTPKGEAKPNAKITDEQAYYIKFISQESNKELALKYGVHPRAILAIRKNETRKWLTIDYKFKKTAG